MTNQKHIDYARRMTPRPISPQIQGRITQAFYSNMNDTQAQFRNVRDVVKREVFDFNTRYNETPTPEEDASIDEFTERLCVFYYLNY